MTLSISLELSHQCPLEEINRHARIMDSHGFYRVWVPDTLVSPWEAWMAASVLLHNTRKIQIGVGVTNPYTRHPVVMAQMAATFQELSNGRLAIAMGKGIGRFLEKAGIVQKPTAMEESVMLMKKLLAGERVDFTGDAFIIDGVRLRTLVPKTKVPILLAVVGPKNGETALARADGITTFWSDQGARLNQQMKAARVIHTAALIPFSLTKTSFFPNTITSLEHLERELIQMEQAGFDEAIIAYGEMGDLEVLRHLDRLA